MSDSEASPSPAAAPLVEAPAGESSPSPAWSEELVPVGEKISELNESQSELLGRLRGLKEDLQSWRNNLDTQVKKYKTEISDIKTALNSEIDQLKSDFQELRTTLKKQQEDVTVSLKNLGLEDATENDGKKGSEDENISEGALTDLGNLKLDDNPEKHDKSSGVEEEKNETPEDSVVDEVTKKESSSDE
ncbi:uncharacterized protein LOC124653822 [Lolium rigidum]|uniref:uncharacterized protein LOC124653822 n=1 Tax=Lolium rigidum TaxID=89674 RepID=UPI001F5C0E43|nr:uncharacterized protein LOC124653822 [Lolium rigidum]